jgi:hypothetical protein
MPMPSPTEAALTEILREFGLPACNEDVVASYLASRGVAVLDRFPEHDLGLVREALLNATGAYDALKVAGLAVMLPGLARCERKLHEGLAALERLTRGEAA